MSVFPCSNHRGDGTRYKIQDTRYKIQDTRYKIQDTCRELQEGGSSAPHPGRSTGHRRCCAGGAHLAAGDCVQDQFEGEAMSEQTRLSHPKEPPLSTDVEGFDSLAELALDMRSSWKHATDQVWRHWILRCGSSRITPGSFCRRSRGRSSSKFWPIPLSEKMLTIWCKSGGTPRARPRGFSKPIRNLP